MTNNYYDDFLEDESLTPESKESDIDKGLEWVNLHTTAKEAFEAINSLKKAKIRYINGHPNKKSYETKSSWTISKAEVARRVDKSAQPLFNSNTYSKGVTKYFNDVNQSLLQAKEERLKKTNKGYQHKSKEELKARTIKLTKENEQLLQKNCEELFEKMLNELPLDVKRKLGVN